jgi:hypothetical protein
VCSLCHIAASLPEAAKSRLELFLGGPVESIASLLLISC